MTAVHWYAPFKGVFTPVVKGPDEGPFLCVSFNVGYAPFIRGALAAMLQRQMWAGSEADVDDMIMKVHQLLYMFGQLTACPLPADLTGEYEEMASLCESIRLHNGKIQALCCGEWSDIDGQEGITIGGPGQPGDGAPQPVPGECQSYHASFLANSQWLLPSVVNAGDVLTFSNPAGAATDGSGSNIWYCPNGSIFFAGACTGIYGTNGADPAPAEAHMGVIAQIAGVWYGTQDPIVVPGGVVNQPVYFQANDVTITDNSGGYTFDVEKCNNQGESFTHIFDVRLSPGPWSVEVDVTEGGIWTPGTGFEASDPATSNPRGLVLVLDDDARMYDEVIFYFENVVLGTDPVPSLKNGFIVTNLLGVQQTVDGQTPTTGMLIHKLTASALADQIRGGWQLSSGAPYNTGALTVWKIVVSGQGPDPF